MNRACLLLPQQAGKERIHEIKHDGFRLMAPRWKTLVRNGNDFFANRFPRIVEAATSLRCTLAFIDGQAIVVDANDLAVFD